MEMFVTSFCWRCCSSEISCFARRCLVLGNNLTGHIISILKYRKFVCLVIIHSGKSRGHGQHGNVAFAVPAAVTLVDPVRHATKPSFG